MIVLDTNVLSALMLENPPEAVIRWLNTLIEAHIWTTSVNVYELSFGVACLAAGKRKMALHAAVQSTLQYLNNRILTLDHAAAEEAALLDAERRRSGKIIGVRDTFIAGIVKTHKAMLATRNIRDFDDAGIKLIDPWSAA